MRHSDINLTMSRYTHIFRGQESEAVAKLPDLSLPSSEQQKAIATGTDGKEIMGEKNSAICLAKQSACGGVSVGCGEQVNNDDDSETPFSKANGRIRTVNPWFTKPELYH